MHSPARIAVVFLALVGLLGGWLWLSRSEDSPGPPAAVPTGQAGPPADLVAEVPGEALLLLTLDVRTLRKTAIGDRLLGRGRRIPGLGLLADVCGQDPLDGVEKLAFAVPTEAEQGDFGLVASGRFEPDALVGCAAKVIARRGGQSTVSEQGRFRRLRESGASPPTAELAVAPGGPAIVGPAAFVDRAIALADGGNGRTGNAQHVELRALVRPGVAVASVVLTEELRRTLADELAAQGYEASPWSASAGVAASLAIEERLRLELALRCRPAEPCLALERELEAALLGRATRFERLLPELAGALRAVTVNAEPGILRVALELMPERAIALVEELMLLAELGRRPEPAPSAEAPAAPPASGSPTAPPPLPARPAGSPAPPARSTFQW